MNTKKIRPLILAVIVLTLALSLWHQSGGSESSYTDREFLFDTECTITAYGKNAEEAVKAAFERLEEVHSLTDMYSESSDVYRINTAAANESVEISPSTADILDTALRISEASDGAFDITVAAVTKLWDFKSEAPKPPHESAVCEALSHVGLNNLILDSEKLTVTKTDSKTEIDLGGAAKGYAGDEALRVMKELGIEAAIADLGGNVTCMGSNPKSKDGKWRVGIQVPFAPTGEYDDIVETSGGAIVTSGTYQRSFEYCGKLYHHIIDPKTGFPAAADYSSVTVICDSSRLADCLATACFVMGRENGNALAAQYGARIIFK